MPPKPKTKLALQPFRFSNGASGLRIDKPREAQTKLKNPYSLPCRYLMAGEWREEANKQATDGRIAFDCASEDRARVSQPLPFFWQLS
jgi:hypothetical protein